MSLSLMMCYDLTLLRSVCHGLPAVMSVSSWYVCRLANVYTGTKPDIKRTILRVLETPVRCATDCLLTAFHCSLFSLDWLPTNVGCPPVPNCLHDCPQLSFGCVSQALPLDVSKYPHDFPPLSPAMPLTVLYCPPPNCPLTVALTAPNCPPTVLMPPKLSHQVNRMLLYTSSDHSNHG